MNKRYAVAFSDNGDVILELVNAESPIEAILEHSSMKASRDLSKMIRDHQLSGSTLEELKEDISYGMFYVDVKEILDE